MRGAGCGVLVLLPAVAEACPVCFRDPESPMTAGVVAGVGTLLGITAFVLSGCVVLIRRLVRAEHGVHAVSERHGA